MHDKKIKALDEKIAELQKAKQILMLEKEIEAIKNSTVVPRIIYQDVYIPRIVHPIINVQPYPYTGPALPHVPWTLGQNGTVLCGTGATNTLRLIN